MRHLRPSPTLPPWRRTLLVLAAGFALAFGTAAPHDPLFEHQGLHGSMVDEAARHPEAPPHLEGSKSTYREACESCLLLCQTGSNLVPPPTLLPEPVLDGIVVLASAAAVSSPHSHPGSARAPPAALSFAL